MLLLMLLINGQLQGPKALFGRGLIVLLIRSEKAVGFSSETEPITDVQIFDKGGIVVNVS